MRRVLNLLILWNVTFTCFFFPIAINAQEKLCDLESPWLTDEIASLLLTSPSVKRYVLSDVSQRSYSIEVQLLLWAYVKGKISVEALADRVNAKSIISRGDDSLMALLWIIAEAGIDKNNKLGLKELIDELDSWADTAIKETPRKMFLAIISASSISGKSQLTIPEIRSMNFQISDPELMHYMAGKHIQDGKYEVAHSLLVGALEHGLFSALLGLGDVEVNYFPECAARGAVYRRLFASIWLQK